MRRTDKEITDRLAIDRILESCQVLRLGLALDNVPYIVPVSYGYDRSAFYFHTALQGRKIEFLQTNPKVCFEVEQGVSLITDTDNPCRWSFAYRSVVGYGTVSEMIGFDEKNHGMLEVMRHYGPEEWSFTEDKLASVRLWRVTVDSISGKQTRDKVEA